MRLTKVEKDTGMPWDKIATGEVVHVGNGAEVFYIKDNDNRAVCLTCAPGVVARDPSKVKWFVVNDVELKVTL